jgi:light-regulated signal transduction histidine kinase (bacteriophytochrome)
LDAAIQKALQHKDLLLENRRLADVNRGHVEELERFRTTVEALIRTVAHEVQDPLRAIATSCRSLEDRHGDILDERAKELIDRALEGVIEVGRLVNDLNGPCPEEPVAGPAACPADQAVADLSCAATSTDAPPG